MWLNPGQIVKRVRLGGPEVVLLFQRAIAAVVGAGGNGDNPHTTDSNNFFQVRKLVRERQLTAE